MDFQNSSALHFLQINAEKSQYWTLNLVKKYHTRVIAKNKEVPKSGSLTVDKVEDKISAYLGKSS